MTLHETLHEELKNALREKNEIKKDTLRGILTAITNELVNQKRKPQEILEDDKILEVIIRQAKQRKDSIQQYEKGGRAELAEKEKEELKILEAYLPQQLSKEEVVEVVRKKMTELSITDKSGAGQLMGVVMKELKGKADGTLVKEVVEELLS